MYFDLVWNWVNERKVKIGTILTFLSQIQKIWLDDPRLEATLSITGVALLTGGTFKSDSYYKDHPTNGN